MSMSINNWIFSNGISIDAVHLTATKMITLFSIFAHSLNFRKFPKVLANPNYFSLVFQLIINWFQSVRLKNSINIDRQASKRDLENFGKPLTSVSSKTGLSLASIVLSVFALGFKLPASTHNFFQSPSVNIDLWSEIGRRIIKLKRFHAYEIQSGQSRTATGLNWFLCAAQVFRKPFDGLKRAMLN